MPMEGVRRVGRDLTARRHIEVYVVAAVTIVVAVLSLVGDVVDDGVRWSVVLAALGLLTYQIALPDREGDPDAVLHTRAVFDDITFSSRLMQVREVWVYGPSAINLLTADVTDVLRSRVLTHPTGAVRIAVLDPEQHEAVAIASRQLDESTEFQSVELPGALAATVERLGRMDSWAVAGTLEYRLAPFNPGFSMVALDPRSKNGLLIVEFHGVRNESDGSRMHVELRRDGSQHWYDYWCAQFEHLWAGARTPPRQE
jgi:hypothetical protein